MKHAFTAAVFALLFMFTLPLTAQYEKNANGLTVRKTFFDFYSPELGGFPNIDKLSGGWEFGFYHNIAPRFNIGIPVRIGIVKQPEALTNTTLFGADAVVQFQHFDRNRLFNPYAVAGVGFTSDGIGFNDPVYHAPLGAGLNINLFNGAYANLQADYRFGLSAASQDFIQYSLGVLLLLKPEKYEKKKKHPFDELELSGTRGDRDGDGVPDAKDECPREHGLANLKGCPDDDGDGVANGSDICPDMAGSPALKGCPDSDGDMIADYADKCPDIKGDSPDGCPTLASKGIDEEQTTPLKNKPTSQRNQSNLKKANSSSVTTSTAPEAVKSNAEKETAYESELSPKVSTLSQRRVLFSSGDQSLNEKAKQALDELVSYLKQHPKQLLALEGHADHFGSSLKNLYLSEARARACYQYLLEKGVDKNQIEYRGFGEMRPAKKSAPGAAVNRRVEFVLTP